MSLVPHSGMQSFYCFGLLLGNERITFVDISHL